MGPIEAHIVWLNKEAAPMGTQEKHHGHPPVDLERCGKPHGETLG